MQWRKGKEQSPKIKIKINHKMYLFIITYIPENAPDIETQPSYLLPAVRYVFHLGTKQSIILIRLNCLLLYFLLIKSSWGFSQELLRSHGVTNWYHDANTKQPKPKEFNSTYQKFVADVSFLWFWHLDVWATYLMRSANCRKPTKNLSFIFQTKLTINSLAEFSWLWLGFLRSKPNCNKINSTSYLCCTRKKFITYTQHQ